MDVDIVPNTFYDPAKAKIYANLRWLFGKAYGPDTPEDLRVLFYVDQYEQEHIKPSVLQLLLSGELYCRVCGLILKAAKTPAPPPPSSCSLRSHQAVIKALLRRGIHVVEADEYVSDQDLSSAPIKMSAHITLIDALMTAYTSERVSSILSTSGTDRVGVGAVGAGAFSQAPPLDQETALVSWINKVVMKMREISDSEHMRKEHLRDTYNYQRSPSKWYWTLVPGRCRDSPEGNPHHFPLVDDLMNNTFTATALLTVIHFYCPALIRLEDICLKEIPPVAETIANIQLLMAFSNKHLNRGFYLKIEDMLYCTPTLKNNMVAFIAELFWLFEKVKPNFVQPRDSQGMRDGLGTKPCFSPVDPQDSILAWPERRKSPVSRSLYHHHHHQEPYSLHNTPPSEGVGFSLAGFSIDPHLQTNTTPSLPRHHPPLLPQPPSGGAGLRAPPGPCKAQGLLGHVYISDQESEVEEEELVLIVHPQRCPGGTPDTTAPPPLGGTGYCVDRQAQESFYLEPLMPAVSRPAKEKSVSLNKQEESGETPNARAGLLQRRGHPEADAPLDLLRATSSSTAITPAPWEQEEQEDSRCPSPCLSTASQASSSCSVTTTGAADSPGIRMTTFADRKLKKKNLKNCPGGGGVSSPTSSSQRTTPDDPDVTFPPAYPRGDHKPCWQGKESSAGLEKEGVVVAAGSHPPAVCSELVQLHMQLVEQQRAIEGQKKKMETAFTQQRLELGKAAFFNVIKKGSGKSDTLPRPPKRSPEVFPDILEWEGGRSKIHPSKDDSCLDEFSLKDGGVARGKMQRGQGQRGDNRLSPAGFAYAGGEPDLYGFCYSLENLNKSVSSIQQKIMQLSLQQSKLMKQGVAGTTPPAATSPDSGTPTKDAPRPPVTPPPAAAVSFSVGDFGSLDDDHDSGFGSTSTRSLGGRSPVTPAKHPLPPPPTLTKPTELKLSREDSSKHSSTTATHQPPSRHRSTTTAVESTERETLEDAAFVKSPARNSHRGSAFTVPCDTKSPSSYLRKGKKSSPFQPPVPVPVPVPAPVPRLPLPDEPLAVLPGPASQSEEEEEEDKTNSSETSDSIGEETDRVESDVTDVDLSEEKVAADSDRHADDEQKNVLGFFYKHEEKAEDEMAKRRAAFLLKQERKAEEARLRKQQQEAENELKRDEARLKAEEERVRKEEEKVRRELIKQEYLQRKRQELLDEQGAVKPRPKTLSARRPRLKSPQHPSSPLSKASPGRDEPTSSHRGSTLSLTAEPDDVVSGRSQRSYSRCSEDSFSVTSVDWDKRSTASFSLTADYNGPKLFKEPTSKSNKTIIINAVAHCCLAGKVNESQKNVVLEELEKCKANHLLILLRDGGCQYRGIYCYLSDSEEIVKFLGTGPRTITRKMVDKLFKYSCDRKQFAVIQTKTLSITVDALTIHNHLWQVKRKGSLTLKK